ncbi:hypothetical protein G3M55_11125, partial [Streptomyces sp. SID8455]|nr:hypothetical protein [Streptomyces sp. SID8455]
MSIDTSLSFQSTDSTDPSSTDGVAQTLDAPQSAATPTPAPAVHHTDGGLPALPLLLITSNTTAAGLSAAAVVGGPLAAAGLAAVGIVTAAALSAGARKGAQRNARRTPLKTPKNSRSNGAGATSASRNRTAGGSGTKTPARTGPGGKGGAHRKPGAAPMKSSSTGLKAPAGKGGRGPKRAPNPPAASAKSSAPKTPEGRVGQIKELRTAKKTEGKTRKQKREQATRDRRALKDGRRGEKAALKKLNDNTKKTPSGKHSTAGTRATLKRAVSDQAAKAHGALTTKSTAVRGKVRDHKDAQVLTRGERIKQARRNAAARATLARKVIASKARYAAKAAGVALLAAPVGLLGCLTTPLGRKLGWSWLMYPGRRLYRRLTVNAKHNHLARVADAKNTP